MAFGVASSVKISELQGRLDAVRATNANRFNQFAARTAVNETVLGGQSPSERLRLALQNVKSTVSGSTTPTYAAAIRKQKDNTVA